MASENLQLDKQDAAACANRWSPRPAVSLVPAFLGVLALMNVASVVMVLLH